MNLFGLPVSSVKGHNEFPGTSTSCPGINMNAVRKRLTPVVEQVSKPQLKPTVNKSPASSQEILVVDGFWGPAVTRRLQQYFGTLVDG